MFPALIKFCVAACLIYWLYNSDFINVSEIALALNLKALVGMFIMIGIAYFLLSERFRQLMITQKHYLGVFNSIQLFLIGHFFNFIIPGGIFGDVVKAYYLKSHDKKSLPYTVIFDRFLGIYSLVLLGLLSCITNFNFTLQNHDVLSVAIAMTMIFLAMNLFWVAAFNKKVRNFITGLIPASQPKIIQAFTNLMTSFELYALQPWRVIYCLTLSLASQAMMILSLYFVCESISPGRIPADSLFFAAPITFVVSALPIAPGGIGTGQAAILELLRLYVGFRDSIGPTAISIFQFTCLSFGFIGLYFYLMRKKAS